MEGEVPARSHAGAARGDEEGASRTLSFVPGAADWRRESKRQIRQARFVTLANRGSSGKGSQNASGTLPFAGCSHCGHNKMWARCG
ncbi:hypothetical protein BRAS3843_740059 [Bradyrhizobium sp. STM 3843]|nr:hypothetical protein BRAS3843_740059 [Bradyrhizobium sp. STM 3843]